MSKVKLGMIWQHDSVLPYILTTLKQYVEKITPVHQIYLYGSRAKTTLHHWNDLKGKDWDIIMVCNFPIVNTSIWTTDKNYYIDLSITTSEKMEVLKKHHTCIELFPNNMLTNETQKNKKI